MKIRGKLGLLLLFIGLFLCVSCEKDKTLESIECQIEYQINGMEFAIGDKLEVTNLELTPITPTTGITITKVEYFLGNRLFHSTDIPPYTLNYTIPELPEGQHLLQIDVHLSAPEYAKTTVWLKQYINIYDK